MADRWNFNSFNKLMIKSIPNMPSTIRKTLSKADLVDKKIISFVKKHGLERVVRAVIKRQRISSILENKNQKPPSKLVKLLTNPEFGSLYFFPFLNLSDLSLLDSSFANHEIRQTWLACRKLVSGNRSGIEFNLYHDDEINWCVSRNIFPQSLSIESHTDDDDHDDDDDTFSQVSNHITDEGLSHLSEHCLHLKYFKLGFTETISNIGFSSFIACCPKLQTLILNSCPTITDDSLEMVAIYCDQVVDINISYCENVSDIGLEAIFKGCTQLKSFSYHCEYQNALKNFRLLTNIGKYCQVLEYLDLAYVVLTTDGIASFFPTHDNYNDKNSLNEAEYNTFKGYKFNKRHKQHNNNNNGRSGDISSRSDNVNSSRDRQQYCQILKSIHIDNIIGVKLDYFLECVGVNCSKLESIELGNIYPIGTEITNHALQFIFKGCGLLKSLRIRQPLPNITDLAFHSLSQLCKDLEEIEFHHIPTKITEKTMTEIGKLKNLRRLHLIHINNDSMMTDIGIYDMFSMNQEIFSKNTCNTTTTTTTSGTSLLESIAITIDGIKITDASIVMIANNCPLLKEIQIIDINHLVSPTIIQYLIHQCTLLREIHNGEVSLQICNELVKDGDNDDDESFKMIDMNKKDEIRCNMTSMST